LKNCSFTIEPREKIGLIGLNGSGKSTIIKLMFRFYDPEEGTIKLDGVDLKEYNVYAVRKIFGVLFQDYVTYCLPFREIVALSDFGERSDDEKLKKVCGISGVSEIIKDWEQGYDSVLGRYYADNGKDLSGGQWQLVGLARAYFKESEYMILDEPSASLDPVSEDRIFEQLYRLSEHKSSVTISHRLSNTTLADKIFVIDGGHIIEQGSHFELLKQNGKYAHLFGLQSSKYI
jgi:ATP-binding cassette subfamily B protein